MRWVAFFVFLSLPFLNQSAIGADGANEILGKVETSEVTRMDIRAELANMSPEASEHIRTSMVSMENLVTDLLTRKVIAEKAEKERITDDPVVRQRIQLAQERILYEAFLEKREFPQLDQQVLERAAKEEYLAFPEKYSREEIRASHILLKRGESCSCDGKKLAESVLARIKAGESFEALAAEYSIDGSAARGGSLGVFPRGKMIPAFENAAFALKKPGDLSDIIETQFGYHIIRLDQKMPPIVQPFEEVKAGLVEATRLKLRGNIRRSIVGPIRANLGESVDRDAVKKLVSNPEAAKP